jgi:hypothetical protein
MDVIGLFPQFRLFFTIIGLTQIEHYEINITSSI